MMPMTNPLSMTSQSLPMLNIDVSSIPRYNTLNSSYMSPSLMANQLTFNTPSSLSQSNSIINQFTQPITHTTGTFGDEKLPDTQLSHYDDMENKLKQLNLYATTPIEKPIKTNPGATITPTASPIPNINDLPKNIVKQKSLT
jgi:hypothetical protein